MTPLTGLAALHAVLLTAAPTPRAPSKSELTVYAPRLDQLGGLRRFFDRASERTGLLRPSGWLEQFHPLTGADPSRPESLTAVGIDPSGSGVVTSVDGSQVTCTALSNPSAFEKAAQEGLASKGDPWRAKASGLNLVGAKLVGEVTAGYVVKGKEACAVIARDDGAPALREAARALSRSPTGAGWKATSRLKGALYFVHERGAVGLSGDASQLVADGEGESLPVSQLLGAGPSPYAKVEPSGVLFFRGRFAPAGAAASVGPAARLIASGCPSCSRAQANELAESLASLLTGQVLLRVSSLRLRPVPSSAAERYFMARHVVVAEVADPAAARARLAALDAWPNVKRVEDNWTVRAGGGEILLGLSGRHLYVGNDAGAVRAVIDHLPSTPGPMPHGAEVAMDPKAVTASLGGLSLLDAVGSGELAGVFAAASELSGLFAVTDAVAGWADSVGGRTHRFGLTWKLKAASGDQVR